MAWIFHKIRDSGWHRLQGHSHIERARGCAYDRLSAALGVAGDQYYSHWRSHLHEGWDGHGDGEGASDLQPREGTSKQQEPHSPRLIAEGAARFLSASEKLGCKRNVVFSSYIWDIKRFSEQQSTTTPLGEWGTQFEHNYSQIVRSLKVLAYWANATLFVTVPFPILNRPMDRWAWQAGIPQRIARVAARETIPLVDLSRVFLRSKLLHDDSNYGLGRPYRSPLFVEGADQLYRTADSGRGDASHQSVNGSALLWNLLAASFRAHALS